MEFRNIRVQRPDVMDVFVGFFVNFDKQDVGTRDRQDIASD